MYILFAIIHPKKSFKADVQLLVESSSESQKDRFSNHAMVDGMSLAMSQPEAEWLYRQSNQIFTPNFGVTSFIHDDFSTSDKHHSCTSSCRFVRPLIFLSLYNMHGPSPD
jgi:hypothetical protein